MKEQEYTVVEHGVRFPHGCVLRISAALARRRRARLEAVEEPKSEGKQPALSVDGRLGVDPRPLWRSMFGVYRVVGEDSGQFKAGDRVAVLGGEVGRGLASKLDPPVVFPPEVGRGSAGGDVPAVSVPGAVGALDGHGYPAEVDSDVTNHTDDIRDAVSKLKESDYTSQGKPKVDAVSSLLGYEVSRKEIAAALSGE